MFEGDSADMCARKFLLVSMAGRAEGLACARTPIGASGNFHTFDIILQLQLHCDILICRPHQIQSATRLCQVVMTAQLAFLTNIE
jgi:hypothetical protein